MEEHYMQMALELAEKARGRTSPNPMVGAVVVKGGKVVGTGYHHQAGTPHAEVHALQDAGEESEGADLYVTLEPCNHWGRTPPCTEAIIKAGIKRVFVAMQDPNPLVSGKGNQRLRDQGLEVWEGILESQARRLNEVFCKCISTNKPFIALKTALTLDGKIATETGQSQWITAEAARLHGHSLRNTYDAILVGIGTVIADNPSLTCRLPNGEGRDPVRVIIDSKLSITATAQVLSLASPAPTIIATTAKASPEKIKQLEKKAQIILVNDDANVSLAELLPLLYQKGISSILVEGGGQINGSFLRENLVDKYYFYLAPKIVGGAQAPGPFQGEGIKDLSAAIQLKDLEVAQVGRDILITGYPDRGEE